MVDRKSFFYRFSCRYYTELSSKQLAQPLSIGERLSYYLHHVICTFCRRFTKQIKVIDKGLLHIVNQQNIGSAESMKLSDQKKAELKARLTRHG